jgi:hypothetical protein
MNTISIPIFAAICLFVITAAWFWRPSLLAIWVIGFLVFPTARMVVGPAPIYLYDLTMAGVLGLLWYEGSFRFWPLRTIRWHGWMIGAAFLLSVLYGIVRYGPAPQILWIWGHTSLSWMGFGVGVVLLTDPSNARYRLGLQTGFLIGGFALCAISLIQYLNLPTSDALNSFFYGGMGAEDSVETYHVGILSNRASGPHFAPCCLAGIAILAGAVFWLVTDKRQWFRRLLMESMCLVTTLCTVSRHAMLAAALGIMVMILFSDNRVRFQLIVGVAIAVVVLTFAAGGAMIHDSWTARMSRFDDGVMDDDNITARVVDGPQRLVDFLGQHPDMLLTGAGIDPEKLMSRSGIDDDFDGGFVSNGFLLSLYYMGIPGFCIYCGFWGWCVYAAATASPSKRGVLLGFIAIAGIIVAADNYGIMYKPASTLLFLVAGLAAAHRELPDEEGEETRAVRLPALLEREESCVA